MKSLSINPGSINFNKNTLTYDVTLDSSTIEIFCEKEDSNSTISGDIGNRNLNYGKNTFKINVISESNEVRTYILNVTKIDNRNTENRLSSIGVNGKNINFNEDKFEYSINVEYDVSTAKITASLKDSSSSFVNGHGPRIVNLNEGNNKIELRILSENGVTRTYTININRKEDPDNKSDDNYLKDIDIKDNDIDFSKDKTSYSLIVENKVTKLAICFGKVEDDTILCIDGLSSSTGIDFGFSSSSNTIISSKYSLLTPHNGHKKSSFISSSVIYPHDLHLYFFIFSPTLNNLQM